jgi:hypothetical protein
MTQRHQSTVEHEKKEKARYQHNENVSAVIIKQKSTANTEKLQ